jgi:hypothetical protein
MTFKSLKISPIILLSAVVIAAIIVLFAVQNESLQLYDPLKSKSLVFSKPQSPLEITELLPVASNKGDGTAARMYVNNRFYHTIEATLPALAKGAFYEGWLVKLDNTGLNTSLDRSVKTQPQMEFLSTGKLFKSQNKYFLKYEQTDNASNFNQVVITIEKVDDKKPETHILEGSF